MHYIVGTYTRNHEEHINYIYCDNTLVMLWAINFEGIDILVMKTLIFSCVLNFSVYCKAPLRDLGLLKEALCKLT